MFSYEDYKEIIRIIQSTGNQAGYEEALTADKFVIMRHDVEYSVDRAYALRAAWILRRPSFSSGRTIPIIFYPDAIRI